MITQPVLCCKHLSSRSGSDWLFRRALVLNWYDGPTSGVVECRGCLAEYHFELIDWDLHWEDADDTRVFSLSPLPPGSLNALLTISPKDRPLQGENGMFFLPGWRLPIETLQSKAYQRVYQRIDEILAQGGNPEWVVAWTHPGEPLLAARKLDAGDSLYIKEWLSSIPKPRPLPPPQPDSPKARDWVVFLGLERLPRGEEEE